VITSSPLPPPFTVRATGDALELGLGLADADAVGRAEGEGVAGGVGVGDPCNVKLAHGFGCTLTQRWWRPGLSPGKGLTVCVKLPPTSVVALPATWLGSSQKSVICS